MKVKDLIELLKSGAQPVMRFTNSLEDFLDESVAEKGMIAKVLRFKATDHDCIEIVFDFSVAREQNIALMTHDWIIHSIDGKEKLGNPLEAKFIKEDLLESDYFNPNDWHELPLEPIEEGSPLNAYLQSKSTQSYVEWLECFWTQKQKESESFLKMVGVSLG